jgi:hypothetical protein
MNLYSIALFLHIVGALGLFIALGLEWASLLNLRRAATAEQVREWLDLFAWTRRLGPISLAVILLAGLYMTATAWRGAAWIVVALAAMVLMVVLGATLTGLRMPAIGRAVAAESELVSDALRHRLRDPLLWTSIQTRAAIALGIVFLMTVKPDLGGALLTIGVAIVLGLATSLPMWGRFRMKESAA